MPNLANITVKKADGTTAVTYQARMGASSDRTPAVWVSTTQGSTPAANPTFEMSSRSNGPQTARRLDHKFKFPVTALVEGRESIVDLNIANGSVVIPQMQSPAQISEFAHQYCNIMYDVIIRASFIDGYAAR